MDLSVIQSSHVQHEKNRLENWLRFEKRGRLAAMSFSDRLRRFYETICKWELAGMKFRVGWKKMKKIFCWTFDGIARNFAEKTWISLGREPNYCTNLFFSSLLTRHEKFSHLSSLIKPPTWDFNFAARSSTFQTSTFAFSAFFLPVKLQTFAYFRKARKASLTTKLTFRSPQSRVWSLSQPNFAIYKLPPDFSSISNRKLTINNNSSMCL